MFNLKMNKPERLEFGNNEHLLYAKLEELKIALENNKTYLRKRREYEYLCDALNLHSPSAPQRIRGYLDKELLTCVNYIEKTETNICKNNNKFTVLLENYFTD